MPRKKYSKKRGTTASKTRSPGRQASGKGRSTKRRLVKKSSACKRSERSSQLKVMTSKDARKPDREDVGRKVNIFVDIKNDGGDGGLSVDVRDITLISERISSLTTNHQVRELTWDQFFDNVSSGGGERIPAVSAGSFRDGELKVDFTDPKPTIKSFLISLPRDFIIFYKNFSQNVSDFFVALFNFIIDKIILFGEICLWIVETFGRAPFRIIGRALLSTLFLLSFLERVLSPLFGILLYLTDFVFRGLRNYGYVLRGIYWRIFGIGRRGLSALVRAPENLAIFLKPQPPVGWSRVVVSFILVCMIIVLPFQTYTYFLKFKTTQGLVLGAATSAYEQLQQAQEATSVFDFGGANEAFKKANQNFTSANEELEQLNFLITALSNVIPQGAIAKKLLQAGQDIAQAGECLTFGLDFLVTQKNQLINVNVGSEVNAPESDLAEKLIFFQEKLDESYPKINNAKKLLDEVSPEIIPKDNQENFVEIKSKVERLQFLIEKLHSFVCILNEVIGVSGPRRYLVIFQNEAELRPTGGFIGSFALIDVTRGQVKKMEIPGGGPYDLKGSLLKRVAPPKPLQRVNEVWQMQDANWFPDFPTSARKIIWFYENAGGPSVDGVIAITSGLVADLLKITGPLEMLEYNKVIDHNNFWEETQMAVEVEYDRQANRPKQFIADLTPKFLNKLLSGSTEETFQVLSIIDQALDDKRILFYFIDNEVQQKVIEKNWAGQIRGIGPYDDYLLVVNANIGSNKTDAVIEQKIFYETEISKDNGTVIDTVTIIRTHKGEAGNRFTGQENFSYMRVYVPFGSVLLETTGFTPLGPGNFRALDQRLEQDLDLQRIEGQALVDERTGTRITNEFGKTVFGNWIVLGPGETVACKLVYRLPFKLAVTVDDSRSQGGIISAIREKLNPQFRAVLYTLLIQKQPGTASDNLAIKVSFPKGAGLRWLYPAEEATGQDENVVQFKSRLSADKYYGVILGGD